MPSTFWPSSPTPLVSLPPTVNWTWWNIPDPSPKSFTLVTEISALPPMPEMLNPGGASLSFSESSAAEPGEILLKKAPLSAMNLTSWPLIVAGTIGLWPDMVTGNSIIVPTTHWFAADAGTASSPAAVAIRIASEVRTVFPPKSTPGKRMVVARRAGAVNPIKVRSVVSPMMGPARTLLDFNTLSM